MLPNNFTHKSQEALQIAQQLAQSHGQPSLEPLHLFLALLEQDDGVVPAVMKKMSVDAAAVKAEAESVLGLMPKVQSSSSLAQVYLSPEFNRVLQVAEQITRQFKDSYISTEQYKSMKLLASRSVGNHWMVLGIASPSRSVTGWLIADSLSTERRPPDPKTPVR
jgi:ATP-dependent Clp protease ATP-binding subunit ClpA